MNREHLWAFLWLRWRLRANQFKKGGTVNAVLFIIFAVMTAVAAIGMVITSVTVGVLVFPGLSPNVRLFVWTGCLGVFLFFWIIGLMADLQRSEGMPLTKFLHLPVSASGAFFVNYLSSLGSITLIMFVPPLIGLALGHAIGGEPVMLLALPLILAFVWALTAVTYQFQGWLATLMANPRRRRTIVVGMTFGVIVMAQAPNLINLIRPWEGVNEIQLQRTTRINQASVELASKAINAQEYQNRLNEIERETAERTEASSKATVDQTANIVRTICAILPPGWLVIGVDGLSHGRYLPLVGGTLGLSLIGAFSLWRAYRTTLKLYMGHYSTGATSAVSGPADRSKLLMVERVVPRVKDHVSGITMASMRSLTRAPEAKMAFLSPFIALVVIGGLAASGPKNMPLEARPFIAIGGVFMCLLMVGMQLIGNQFGYDRSGFRAYVLSPLPRRDVLLGKNLAIAPFAIGMSLLVALFVGIVFPLRIDHYPMVMIQIVCAYLIVCMMGNFQSILAPLAMSPSGMQVAKVKAMPILFQMLMVMIMPLAFLPVVVPMGVEFLLNEYDIAKGWPIGLGLTLLLLGVLVMLYRVILNQQGKWLFVREQKILETVTSQGE